jgi:hypothetical protein
VIPQPAPVPPPIDPHDEVTVIDNVTSVTMPGGRIKPRIHWCDGRGFALGILDKPFVTPCWCPAGRRLLCATVEGAWPLKMGVAARIAKKIGLRKVAA